MSELMNTTMLVRHGLLPSQADAARTVLARHAQSLRDYDELCQMVLDEGDALGRYWSWLADRS